MRAVGFGEEQVAAIPAWNSSDVFSPPERAVLAYTDELVLQGGRVQDDTFARLRRHLSEEEILELTYITLTYELHATMCRALRMEYDDVDERVVEIPAPDSAGSVEVMADVSRTDGG